MKTIMRTICAYLAICALMLAVMLPLFACGGGGTPPHPSDSPGPKPCAGGDDEGPRSGGGGGGGGGGAGPCGGSPVDSINTFTGNLTIADMPVYYAAPPGGIPFSVIFNSQSARTGVLGDRWTHSYNSYLINDAPYGVYVIEANGREAYFIGTDPYMAEPGNFDTLVKTWSGTTWTGWLLTRSDNTKLTFNTSGKLTKYTNADGLNWTLTYSSGLLTTITDPKSRQTTLQYTSGLLTRVTVPGGLYATFQYDTYTPKRLWKITDAAGDTYTFGYSGTRITSITDPSGNQVWYSYGTFNNKSVISSVGVTNVSASTVNYTYSPQANGQLYVDITAQKDGAARVTRHIYEFTNDAASGRYYGALLEVNVDPSSLAIRSTYAYDSQFRMIRYRDSYQPESGGKTHLHYFYYTDSNNPDRVTKYIDAENYDSSLGSNSPSYRFQYDTRGNLTKITTPENRVTDITYVAGTDRISSVIVRDQDINGSPIDRITSFTYWTSTTGYLLKTITDARSNVTTFYYDSNWYLDYVDPPLGNNIQVTANSVGDITAITDGNGSTTSFFYDGIHRLYQITYPDIGAGQKTRILNWLCCGLDSITDENGRITDFQYEQYTNRLKKIVENYGGLNYTTEYTYDEVGNVKTVKNARLKTTTYTYDKADRLTRIDYPDNTYETWTLRDDGRVYQHRDGRGRITTYRYDADDRLAGSGSYVAINYPNDTDVKIVRDKDSLITSVTDSTGTSNAVYYPSGWLKSFTNGAGKTVTYEYNGVGAVSTMKTPDNLNFTYLYNALNQLTSITNPNSETIGFVYDNGGRRTRMDRTGGYTEWAYNARNWLTAVRSRDSGAGVEYDAEYYYQDGALWDHAGNPLKKVEYFPGTGAYTTTLRYDNVYRLTQETRTNPGGGTDWSYAFAYDQVGNRTSETIDSSTRYYTYDDNDKLTQMGTTQGGNDLATFGYDGSGNMISVAGSLFGSRTLVYDDENRLTSITYPGGSDSFVYNALGQRLRATLNGTTSRYVYHGQRVLEETDDSGAVLARYTTESGGYYGPMWHLWRASGESRFPLYDGAGSVHRLVDSSNNHTDIYELAAFGQVRSSTITTPNPYKFGGAWGYITDPSGLQQLGARFYWPEVGRFIQQDPIGDGMNWYAYAGNNPVISIDPEGLCLDYIADAAFLALDVAAFSEDPSLGNALLLGADIGLAVLPVVPAGAGAGFRAAKGVETVIDASKGIKPAASFIKREGQGARKAAKIASKTEKHHTVPRKVLKQLNPHVADDPSVRGGRGNPNRIRIPKSVHRGIHSGGPKGGKYNNYWESRLSQVDGGSKLATVDDILGIKRDALREFGLDSYKGACPAP